MKLTASIAAKFETSGAGRAFLAALALAICAFAASAAPASADPTTATVDSITSVSYASAHVTATIDTEGETYWRFDYSSDGVSWVEGPGEAHGGPIFGDETVSADLTGLKGGTKYFVRVGLYNASTEESGLSAEPNAEFETLPVDPPAVLSVADATSVQYTSVHVAGEIERPANPDPAFDADCRFEYVTDAQFAGTGFEGAGQAPCEPENPVTAAGTSAVAATLSGLANGTEYHLRLTASNAGGSDSKIASTFTTLTVSKPTVSIDPVTTFTDSTAHFSGHVNPGGGDPAFQTNWEFQCTPACPGLSGSVATEDISQVVQADAAALEPNTDYDVKLIATNAGGTESAETSFNTAAVAPSAETVPAFAIQGGTEAMVAGRVNPKNSATTYWIEYGTTAAYGISAPVGEDASAGSGAAAQIFSQTIAGLTPSTVYHFRVVAENASGRTDGDDESFETAPAAPPSETCSNTALREANNSNQLPDCRAYEQVSPTTKNGYDAGTSIGSPVYQAAPDGSALSFESFGAYSSETLSAGVVNPYLSRRLSSGWKTISLNPPIAATAHPALPVVKFYTPNLDFLGLITEPAGSLAPGDVPGRYNLYWRDNDDGSYRTLSVSPSGDPLDCRVGSGCAVVGASADQSHVLFEANDETFESVGDETRRVSILPSGAPTRGRPGPPSGGSFVGVNTHLISDDGSRIVFTGFDNADKPDLYVRVDGDHTVLASKSERAASVPFSEVIFSGASADLSRVFFTANGLLTEDAQPDYNLYMYEVETDTLTDLSVNTNPAEEAGIFAEMDAVSEDGSYVYFRAPNRLLPGQQGPADGSNIYLWHEGSLSLAVPGVSAGPGRISRATDYVTPDGRFLLFGDDRQLTAYDNRNAATDAPEREYYLYDSLTDRLTCVSCDPDGGRPSGGSTTATGATRQQSFVPIVVSDAGDRVFFSSASALVPEDVNGKLDAYVWEDGIVHLVSSGQHGDPSLFIAASREGDNAFFSTRQRLVPSDRDDNVDVYDARVGGGFPQPPPASICEGIEGCHGPAVTAPALGSPSTSSFSSDAKPASPSARRLRKALKACSRKPTKKARAKCKAKAKKRYGKAQKGRNR